MATKPVTTDVAALAQLNVAQMNANFATLEDAIEAGLGRGGTDETPNSMTGDLDMDLNQLKNLPTPQVDKDGANKAYVDGLIASLVLDDALVTTSKSTGNAVAWDAVNNNNITTTFETYTELRGIDAFIDGDAVVLLGRTSAGDGGGGILRWSIADLSTEVTADAESGVYVAPDSDSTGASGAWIRQIDSEYNAKWFGAKGDGATDDRTALYSADAMGNVYLPGGSYKVNSNLTFTHSLILARTATFNVAAGVTVILDGGYGLEPTNYNTGSGTLDIPDTNVALGDQVLRLNTTGLRNTGVGALALRLNTSGSNNIALGAAALYRNVDGDYNVALGTDTMQHNTEGFCNTAVGRTALHQNTTGDNNIAVGSLAIDTPVTGSRNVAVGVEALHGYNDQEMLDDSGFDNIAAHWTTSLGTFPAGGWAVGSSKVLKNADGLGILWDLGGNAPILAAIGLNYTIEYEVADLTAGSLTVSYGGVNDSSRTADGVYSYNLTATHDTRLTVSPTNTSRFSLKYLKLKMTSVVVGDSNIALGTQANYFRASGDDNTAIGETALMNNYTGSRNVALGNAAGKWERGDDKFFVNNVDRLTEADDRSKSLLYGVFASDTDDQLLAIHSPTVGLNKTPGPIANTTLLDMNGTTVCLLRMSVASVTSAQVSSTATQLTISNEGNGSLLLYTNDVLGIQMLNNGEVRMPAGAYANKYAVSAMQTPPATAGATGTTGEIRYTSDYIYVCVATDTWKRTAISTW